MSLYVSFSLRLRQCYNDEMGLDRYPQPTFLCPQQIPNLVISQQAYYCTPDNGGYLTLILRCLDKAQVLVMNHRAS